MNREEEITKASLDFSPCFEYRREIFIKGAKWADEHPANPWHKNIDGDLPKKSGRYLVMAQNGFCHTRVTNRIKVIKQLIFQSKPICRIRSIKISNYERNNRNLATKNRLLHKGNAESRTACPINE